MSTRKYTDYKDSGIPWVGTIPLHWGIQPLLSVARERNEANIAQGEKNLLSLSYGRIVPKDIESNDGLLPASFETYQIVHVGDLIVRLTDLQNDKRSLRSAIVERQGIITSAYLCVTPTATLPAYFGYLFRSYDLTKVLYSMGGGLRQSLRFFDIKRLPIVVPPLEEQGSIVELLDRETGKIDALIAEQQKLLKLLAEKRQATISHAVTIGLDGAVAFKDSGVKWLGRVPCHWHVKRLRFVVGLNPSKGEAAMFDRDMEVSFLPMDLIGCDGSVNVEQTRVLSSVESAYTYFRDGDVVIAKITPCFENYKGAIVRGLRGGIGFGTTELIVARPKVEQTTSAYLQWIFVSPVFRKHGEGAMYGAGGQKRVPDAFVLDFPFGFPPLPEQGKISAFLDRETSKIDALMAEQLRAVKLLKERRSALISAAVTGKIGVRNYVAGGEAAAEAAPIA